MTRSKKKRKKSNEYVLNSLYNENRSIHLELITLNFCRAFNFQI